MTRRLNRSDDGRPAAPIRIVHLGVGNFFRAHQAWFTEHAPDAAEWGIAAFTGRRATVADQLSPAEGLYTLVVQGAGGNDYQVISSLSAVHPGSDLAALREYAALPELALVTSTVTEAGYMRTSDGADLDDARLAADITALRADPLAADVTTTPGRMVALLLARRQAGLGGVTFVPCDNVPENGPMVRGVVRAVAEAIDTSLLGWIDERVGFVTTMVDRITPRVTEETIAAIASDTGIDDQAAVVTEPFAEWVLAGDFVAGRPAWQATFVDDVAPYETRKLWLLNGSHSLLAYAGSIAGHSTVGEAIADADLRAAVEQWWDEACRHLTLTDDHLADYRAALLERFGNPAIKHLLAQIAADGSQKMPIRIVAVLNAERAAGRSAEGACRVIAAWIAHLRGHGAAVQDVSADEFSALATGEDAVAAVCDRLGVNASAQPLIGELLAGFEA